VPARLRDRLAFARALLGAALLTVLVAAELLGVLGGRAATLVAVLGVALPGTALVLFLRRRPRGTLARRRLRFALVGLFVVGFAVVQVVSDTRPWKDWKETLADPARASAVTAVFPPAPYHPSNVGESQMRATERVLAKPSARNWLGCDTNGQDVFTRLLFGTRISLTIGLVAVGLYVLIGIFFGGLAGYYRGWVDLTISRLIEIMICFPSLFLILTIIAVFETRSIFLIMAAIGVVGWPGVARLVRGEFLRQRNLDYVTAAKAQGLPERRILFRHVLPNCLGPVLVSATFGIAGAIIVESGLAFLGLGDKSAPSWGEMLTMGRVSSAWHLILVPGTAIFFVVTIFNLLGEGLRDALDPKLRR
jgi:peptide/nickel transport system permease protein